jgi:hypothetical protein
VYDIRPKRVKRVKNGQNSVKIDKTVKTGEQPANNGQKMLTTVNNGQQWAIRSKAVKTNKSCQKQSKTVINREKCTKTDKNGQKRSKTINKRQQLSKAI